jgi:very-short-patch-repair endonuclease
MAGTSKNIKMEPYTPYLEIPTEEEFLYITDSTGKTQPADSSFEIAFANVLDKLNLQFIFQYPFHGWSVDFVLILPKLTPVELNGDQWHTGRLGADDYIKEAVERNEFGILYILWWHETEDDERLIEQWIRTEIL